jgi:hypothetical protein
MTHNVHSTVRDLETLAEKIAARSADGQILSKSAVLNLITRCLLGDGRDWAAIKNASHDIASQRYRAAQATSSSNKIVDAILTEMVNAEVPTGKSAVVSMIAEKHGKPVRDIPVVRDAIDALGLPSQGVLTKERYKILMKIDCTGVPLYPVDFENVATINHDRRGWAEPVLLEMEKEGLTLRDGVKSAKGESFDITQAGRAALKNDPVEVKRRGISEAMVKVLLYTAQAQEHGHPAEISGSYPALNALENRGLITFGRPYENMSYVRLTAHGKIACERMLGRDLAFPLENDLG